MDTEAERTNCFKVCTITSHNGYEFHISYNSVVTWTGRGLQYIPGVETFPKVGKIFVFALLRHALEFVQCEDIVYPSGTSIWACKAKRMRPLDNILIFHPNIRDETINNFWTHISNPRIEFHSDEPVVTGAPYGTFIADSVTLIRRVR